MHFIRDAVSLSSLYTPGTLPPCRSSRAICWSWHASITLWGYVMTSRGEWGPNRNYVKPFSSTTQGRTGTTTTVKALRTSLYVRWRSATPCLGARTVGSCWPYTTTRCTTWQAAPTQRPALTNVCRRRLPPAPHPACLATCTTCGNSWPCLYGTINWSLFSKPWSSARSSTRPPCWKHGHNMDAGREIMYIIQGKFVRLFE